VDAVEGLYNPQLLMMGSGVLEWVRASFYPSVAERAQAYATMIGEAREVPPGAGGLMMVPSFKPDTGPTRKYGTEGTLVGIDLGTTRAHVYRAAVEGLCLQLRQALEIMREATGSAPSRLRVVGGGSKNELWNQLRADVCRMPVVITERKEAAVVGAAISAWTGAGRFTSIPEGMSKVPMPTVTVEPGPDAERYEEMYRRYGKIAPGLRDYYKG
jgi:L-fuculokinase